MATAIAPSTAERLLTAEEYMELPDDGRLTELVRGRIVEMPQPKPKHGYYCLNLGSTIREYVKSRELGRVVSNDSGVKTEHGPDTVRGPDVAYYSYSTVPKGPMPDSYWPTPELVLEVKSPTDRWPSIMAKVAEYLNAGVMYVCVLDPDSQSMIVSSQNEIPRRLTLDEELTLPELFPEFRAPMRQFFE